MAYTIGFSEKNERQLLSTEAHTANQALTVVETLQKAASEIIFIRSPQEGDIGIEMLRILAKEEAEEMPGDLMTQHQVHPRIDIDQCS